MRRRTFLTETAAGAAVAVAAAAVVLRGQIHQRVAGLTETDKLRKLRRRAYAVPPGEPGPLDPRDEITLWAVALVVLPTAAARTARTPVLEHLRWRANESPGYRRVFTESRALLDTAARNEREHATFADLDRSAAGALLTGLIGGIEPFPRHRALPVDLMRFALSPTAQRRFRLRRHVVNEILHAYYTSPAGWISLGNDAYPGGCHGLDRYSRAPALSGAVRS